MRKRLSDSMRARASLREELQAAGGRRLYAALRLAWALLRNPGLVTGLLAFRRYRAAIRTLASWKAAV